MKAKLIKVIEIKKSSNGANRCYLLCFKGVDGKSYKTYTDERLGNYKRWYNAILGLVTCTNNNTELWMNGLNVKGNGLIDADSMFKMEVKEPVNTFIPNHDANIKPEIERKDTQ